MIQTECNRQEVNADTSLDEAASRGGWGIWEAGWVVLPSSVTQIGEGRGGGGGVIRMDINGSIMCCKMQGVVIFMPLWCLE